MILVIALPLALLCWLQNKALVIAFIPSAHGLFIFDALSWSGFDTLYTPRRSHRKSRLKRLLHIVYRDFLFSPPRCSFLSLFSLFGRQKETGGCCCCFFCGNCGLYISPLMVIRGLEGFVGT
ncbi:hypothetical protein BC567DRAFT_6437 [Phyllosticta citribraziliensis]